MSDALLIKPREHDLGDFVVRRLLPFMQRRTVGPFIFFDHMGPAHFPPGRGIDVRPHPHIGLATITWLFEGQILHRDSVGSEQTIDPGDVNWMIAGSGIAHSERVTDEVREKGQRLHGLQLWIALPASSEEVPPEFHHYAAASLPRGGSNGAEWTLIAGSAYSCISPAKTFSPMAYLDIRLAPGASLELPRNVPEKAIYVVEGAVTVDDGAEVAHYEMAAWDKGETLTVSSQEGAHLVMVGGHPLAEPRFIYWNFVSSSKDRLEQAKRDWKNGTFAKVPGDEIEFIPLPD